MRNLVTFVLIMACLAPLVAGCSKYKTDIYYERDSKRAGVSQQWKAEREESGKGKGGIKKMTTETVNDVSITDPSGIPIGVQPDPAVTEELNQAFPPELGYEWEGFVSGNGTSTTTGLYQSHFMVTNVVGRHHITERVTGYNSPWEAGYVGEFLIGPGSVTVGGIAELPPAVADSSGRGYVVLAGIAAGLVLGAAVLVGATRRARRARRVS